MRRTEISEVELLVIASICMFVLGMLFESLVGWA